MKDEIKKMFYEDVLPSLLAWMPLKYHDRIKAALAKPAAWKGGLVLEKNNQFDEVGQLKIDYRNPYKGFVIGRACATPPDGETAMCTVSIEFTAATMAAPLFYLGPVRWALFFNFRVPPATR